MRYSCTSFMSEATLSEGVTLLVTYRRQGTLSSGGCATSILAAGARDSPGTATTPVFWVFGHLTVCKLEPHRVLPKKWLTHCWQSKNDQLSTVKSRVYLLLWHSFCCLALLQMAWPSAAKHARPTTIPLAFSSGTLLASPVMKSIGWNWCSCWQGQLVLTSCSTKSFNLCIESLPVLLGRMDIAGPSSSCYWNLSICAYNWWRSVEYLSIWFGLSVPWRIAINSPTMHALTSQPTWW